MRPRTTAGPRVYISIKSTTANKTRAAHLNSRGRVGQRARDAPVHAKDIVVDHRRQWKPVKNGVAPFPHFLSQILPKPILPHGTATKTRTQTRTKMKPDLVVTKVMMNSVSHTRHPRSVNDGAFQTHHES